MRIFLIISVLLLKFRFNIASQRFLSTSTLTLRRSLLQQSNHHHRIRLVKRFSTETSFTDEDLARWERMYEGGASMESNLDTTTIISGKSEIRIVSFDLDDTVWKTFECINAANDALATFLDEHKIKQPKRVEHIMKDLFLSNKRRYSPVLGDDAPHATLLTLLRTDAIVVLLTDFNEFPKNRAEAFAQQAFDVWTTARHDAIPHNLAKNVLDCLEKISSLKTSQGHPVVIGAITDGNSDPRRVPILEKYFQFCVNAEQVGVSKPDKRVYLEAIRQIASNPATQGLIDMEGNNIEAGPYWVHVGDDFVKDIVAAKDLNMRTVWATELIRENMKTKVMTDNDGSKKNDDGTEVKDFVKRISDQKVVEMAIGADSYLADCFTREFVDAVTEEFHHLGSIITEWHAEGISSQVSEATTTDESSNTVFDEKESISIVMPDVQPSILDSNRATQVQPRVFRIIREEHSLDVAAPLLDRDALTMKEVMGIAQLDKASGVFAFQPEDVDDIRVGTKVLMIKVGETDLEFSREIFSKMTVQEVLSLADQNPLRLALYVKRAVSEPSFDLF